MDAKRLYKESALPNVNLAALGICLALFVVAFALLI